LLFQADGSKPNIMFGIKSATRFDCNDNFIKTEHLCSVFVFLKERWGLVTAAQADSLR